MRNGTVQILALGGALAAAALAADRPAFPGAEGFGAATPGGRGGEVLFVTNLNDSGRGSLREACTAKGPRIVVFRVGGIIDLKSAIAIREPYLTIAGQSAPGDGICVRGYELNIDTHDVIVRHFRSRVGDISGGERDGFMVGGDSRNVIVDHCSVTWAVDENLSPSGNIADVTVQWCLIAESLNRSVHHKGPHGYGSLVRAVGGLTMHHNLWAHNGGRNPRLGDNYAKPPFPTFDIRNNVMYNYRGRSLAGDTLDVNYIANYRKPGPDSDPARSGIDPTPKGEKRFYFSGNVVEGRPEFARDQNSIISKPVTFLDAPRPAPKVQTQSAAEAYRLVLERAGATAPVRDAVDRRIVQEVRSASGAIIDSQWEVGCWPQYRGARPPRDTDRDGIPDAWEKAHGLNPRDAHDAQARRNPEGRSEEHT